MHLSLPLQNAIGQRLAKDFSSTKNISFSTVGGGSINAAYRIWLNEKQFFCKLNSATKFPQLFKTESASLRRLKSQNIIAVPTVIDYFETEGQQVLLLEWIEPGDRTTAFWEAFGQQLAALHQVTQKEFGLKEDNYMGSVPQSNKQHQHWDAFFINERLLPMIGRCEKSLTKNDRHLFESLFLKLPSIFSPEEPSLLHGDLWSGNYVCNQSSQPVLIDPAVYFGHRSVDLALTTLFGGFRQPFYDAYHYHYPLPPNYEEQWAVCNLYPLLIHVYLFGSSYLPQIQSTLKQFA